MLTNQRNELVGCNQESYRIDKSKQPQNDKARQPIGVSEREKVFQNSIGIHEIETCLSPASQSFNAQYPIEQSLRLVRPR